MLKKTLIASAVFFAIYANNAIAECPPDICAADDVNVEEVTKKIEENKDAKDEDEQSLFDELVDSLFENKDELPGQECLDGLQSINISMAFVDPTSGFPSLLSALLDQIINAACDAAVTAANKQIEKANKSITDFGKKMDEKTYGFASAESESREYDENGKPQSGVFSFDAEVKSLKDHPKMGEASKAWNEEVGKALYGDSYQSGAASDIDLGDDRYWDEDDISEYEGSYKPLGDDINAGDAAQESMNNAINSVYCYFKPEDEDCEREVQEEKAAAQAAADAFAAERDAATMEQLDALQAKQDAEAAALAQGQEDSLKAIELLKASNSGGSK